MDQADVEYVQKYNLTDVNVKTVLEDERPQQRASVDYALMFLFSEHIGTLSFISSLFSDCGEVFVWGYGILGKGPDLEQSQRPVKIPVTLFGKNEFNTKTRVVDIKAGLSQFAAITSKSRLCFKTHRGSVLGTRWWLLVIFQYKKNIEIRNCRYVISSY